MEQTEQNISIPAPAEEAYEAPAVESVVTPDSLEREVLYAGTPIPSNSF